MEIEVKDRCHCCEAEYYRVYENTFECKSCGHIYRRYLGNEVEYHQNQYRNIERRDVSEISDDGVVKPLFHEKRKEICERRVSLVSQYLSKVHSYLDIGAGAGTYIDTIRDKVGKIECTELDGSLIQECKRLGFRVYEESFLEIEFSSKYDVVSAWHVLEHVDDADRFLQKCSSITSEYCIIEVPLLVSISGTGRRRRLVDPHAGVYDGHAHYFTKKSFEIMASKYFKIIELKEGVQSPALFAVLGVKK